MCFELTLFEVKFFFSGGRWAFGIAIPSTSRCAHSKPKHAINESHKLTKNEADIATLKIKNATLEAKNASKIAALEAKIATLEAKKTSNETKNATKVAACGVVGSCFD